MKTRDPKILQKDLKALAEALKTALPAGRAAIEAREKWSFDRSKFLNASEAASCIRMQYYAKHNPEKAWTPNGFARRGSHAEAYMIESLQADGYEILYALDEQESVQSGQLSASPDGFLVGRNGTFWDEAIYFETKTIDPRTNRANLPRERHLKQVEVGIEICDTVPRGDQDLPVVGGVILYMDASDFDRIDTFVIPRNPDVLKWADLRAKKVLGARKVTSMDREGKKNGDCKLCAFRLECLGEEADVVVETGAAKANRGSKFDELVAEYGAAGEAEKAAKKVKDGLKEDILKELRKRNATTVPVGDWDVTLAKKAGSVGVDKAALQKLVADQKLDWTDYTKIGAPSEALTISRRA